MHLAVSRPSRCIKINVCYQEIPVSAVDPLQTSNPDFRMAAYPRKAASRSSEPTGTTGQNGYRKVANLYRLSVLYAEWGYAGFDRFGVGCDTIFFSSLNDGFKFMGLVVLPKRGTVRAMGLSFDCCSVSSMLDYKLIGFPLREALW